MEGTNEDQMQEFKVTKVIDLSEPPQPEAQPEQPQGDPTGEWTGTPVVTPNPSQNDMEVSGHAATAGTTTSQPTEADDRTEENIITDQTMGQNITMRLEGESKSYSEEEELVLEHLLHQDAGLYSGDCNHQAAEDGRNEAKNKDRQTYE
ncbi:MAG: hypothetical protein Q9192_006259 [Flavoplaca navasiana]